MQAVLELLALLWQAAGSEDDLATAKGALQRMLALQETLIGPKGAPTLDLAATLNNLGVVAFNQSDFAYGKGVLQRALQIQEKLAGADSLAVANTLNSLGLVVAGQGDLAGARAVLQRAEGIFEKKAPDTLAFANVLNSLGLLASGEGDLAGGRAYLERTLAIQEKKGPASGLLANTLNSLGVLAWTQGDIAGGKTFLLRALAILEKEAPGSLAAALNMHNLGAVATAQGDLAGGKAFFQRALALQEKLAPGSSAVAMSLNSLGGVAWLQGDLAAAREFNQRALAIQEKNAPNSLDTARSLTQLGTVASSQGDLAAAKGLYSRALAIQQKAAPKSLDVASSLSALGMLQDEIGEPAEAMARLREALGLLEASAPNALGTARVLRALAQLLLERGDMKQAKEYLERAERIEEATRSVPSEVAAPGGPSERITRPEVRVLSPEANSQVQGEDVSVSVALLAPLPLAHCRVWVNGRPLGGEHGFDLSERAVNDKGRIIEKGRILDKGEVRAALAKETPAEVAELVRKPQYAHYQQVRLQIPVEDTDGEYVRIAIAAETTGGVLSNREILRLRRPEAEAARGALRVLAIGVGDYARIPKLTFPAADARDLAGALEAQAGDRKLYRSASVKILTDAQATLPAVREALATFTRDVQPGETLILLLSGHGVKDPAKMDAGSEGFFFAPVDLDPGNVAGTGLPWKEVLGGLEAARQKAKSVWVLADCCRAAPGLARERQATSQDLRRGVEEGGNLVICTASSGDRPSYESDALKHGLFTQAWLEALRGQAPELAYETTPRGKILTLSGAQLVVPRRVKELADREGVRQKVEFPQLQGSFSPGQPLFVAVPQTP
jgi:tetratricopeptide (TPR) repeat protein